LLASNPCHFLCLETKKVTKESSRLQIILGRLFFSLPTQYNSLVSLAQTVLLTAGLRSKLQNSRFIPKLSEAVRNPKFKERIIAPLGEMAALAARGGYTPNAEVL
jgi:hypothetical protein